MLLKFAKLQEIPLTSWQREGTGTAKFLVQDKEGKDVELLVPNCLYVPKIKHELLSTSQLNQAGHDVLLSNNNSCIVHKDGSIIPLKLSNGLYYIPPVLDRSSGDEDVSYSIIGRTWKLLRAKLGASSAALAEEYSAQGLSRSETSALGDRCPEIPVRSDGEASDEFTKNLTISAHEKQNKKLSVSPVPPQGTQGGSAPP